MLQISGGVTSSETVLDNMIVDFRTQQFFRSTSAAKLVEGYVRERIAGFENQLPCYREVFRKLSCLQIFGAHCDEMIDPFWYCSVYTASRIEERYGKDDSLVSSVARCF